MKPKAFIYGERPHRELSIHEVPLWSFNDRDNVHEIENQKQMADEIVATRGSLNNHLIYSQEDYPGIIYDASKIEPVAKVSSIKYDEDTKTFIADITSTNQQFIDMIAATEYFPRVHPCYEAETNHRFVEQLTTISSTFKRLLCWLVEPIKNITKMSIEYHPEGRTDESENVNNDTANISPRVPIVDEIPLPKEEHSAFSQSLIKDGKRPSKIDYYLAMAEVASTRGTCLRRRYGSVIVKDDRIVSTGYAGAPSGRQNCCDIGYCRREKLNAPRGKMYHLCRSCHSEQNAIINASKEEMLGATLYLAGVNVADGSIVKNADCCSMCKRFIINSGISRVIIKDPEKPEGYRAIDVSEWVSNDDSLDAEVGY